MIPILSVQKLRFVEAQVIRRSLAQILIFHPTVCQNQNEISTAIGYVTP